MENCCMPLSKAVPRRGQRETCYIRQSCVCSTCIILLLRIKRKKNIFKSQSVSCRRIVGESVLLPVLKPDVVTCYVTLPSNRQWHDYVFISHQLFQLVSYSGTQSQLTLFQVLPEWKSNSAKLGTEVEVMWTSLDTTKGSTWISSLCHSHSAPQEILSDCWKLCWDYE